MCISALVFCFLPASVLAADVPPPPQLAIVNAGSDGFAFSQNTSKFKRDFIIESKNAVDVADLRVEVRPFVLLEDGDSAAATAESGDKVLQPETRIAVAGLGDIRITVSASLTEAGVYESTMTLRFGKQRITTKIAVIRKRDTVDATLTPSGTGFGTTSIVSAADVNVLIAVENGGRSLSLAQPALRELTRKSDGKDLSAEISGISFFRDDDSSALWPITLEPGGAMGLRLSIDGLVSPGQYEGRVLFPSAERSPGVVAIAFHVRRHFLEAAFVIALGLALSVWLRHMQENIQPRLRQQVDVLNLLSRLRGILDQPAAARPEDRQLIKLLDDRLTRLYDDLLISSIDSADATITEISQKLPLVPRWINAHSDLELINPASARPLRDELTRIFEILVDAGTSEADINSTKTRLDALRAKIAKEPIVETVAAAAPPAREDLDELQRNIRSKLRQNELLFNVVMLVVAVILGVYLLWSPNNTWGGPNDLLVAFLWGLGLHAISSSQQFEGLGTLAGRFGKS